MPLVQTSSITNNFYKIFSFEPTGCNRNQFACSDGKCIPERYRCDRRHDCSDMSDEFGCGKSKNNSEITFARLTHFLCGNEFNKDENKGFLSYRMQAI